MSVSPALPRPKKLSRAEASLTAPPDSLTRLLPEAEQLPPEVEPPLSDVDELEQPDEILSDPLAGMAPFSAADSAPPTFSTLAEGKKKNQRAAAPEASAKWMRPLIVALAALSCWLLVSAGQRARVIAPFSLSPLLLRAAASIPVKSMRASLVKQAVTRTGMGKQRWMAWPALAALCAALGINFLTAPKRLIAIAMRLGSMKWDENDFCRGWLVTGATGSGKTAAAIVFMVHAACRSMPKKDGRPAWGGVCFDEKGLFYQTFIPILETYGRGDDVILLQVRPNEDSPYEDPDDLDAKEGQDLAKVPVPADGNFRPKHRLNLLYNNEILSSAYSSVICDTAKTVRGSKGGESSPVFSTTAEISIRIAIDLCRAIEAREAELMPGLAPSERFTPNLRRIYELLSSRNIFDEQMVARGVLIKTEAMTPASKGAEPRPIFKPGPLLSGPPTRALSRLERFMKEINSTYFELPKDTFGGVKMNALSYLSVFTQEDIAEVFCTDCTFTFDELDEGKILFIAMPQCFRIERRYICAILKLLTYQALLNRFDLPVKVLRKKPVIIIWQDEAQRYINIEDGNADVLREAKGAIVIATQMQNSLWKPLGGRDEAGVIIENLRNRFIFQSASADCAEASAKFIGQQKNKKRSKSSGRGGGSVTTNEEVGFKREPYVLRNELKKFDAFCVHASGKFRRVTVPCLDAKGDAQQFWLDDIRWRHPIVWLRFSAERAINRWRRSRGRRP